MKVSKNSEQKESVKKIQNLLIGCSEPNAILLEIKVLKNLTKNIENMDKSGRSSAGKVLENIAWL